MNKEPYSADRAARVILWIARIWGILFVVMVLVIGVAGALNPDEPSPTPREWIGIALFPVGVSVGYALGWRWQLLGGTVSLGCLAAFFVWLLIERGGIRAWPVFLLFGVPGMLFVAYWFISRRREAVAASD